MTYSDAVATTALVVSLLTASWTLWRAWRWDRPVVSVSGTQWIGGRSAVPDNTVAGFSLEVINTGNQATQIHSAFWQIDRGNGADIRFTASHGGGGVESLFEPPEWAKKTPELPFTLERYERREWNFEMNFDGITKPEGILRARPVVQFTSKKKTELARGRWQPSQIAIEASRRREESEA